MPYLAHLMPYLSTCATFHLARTCVALPYRNASLSPCMHACVRACVYACMDSQGLIYGCAGAEGHSGGRRGGSVSCRQRPHWCLSRAPSPPFAFCVSPSCPGSPVLFHVLTRARQRGHLRSKPACTKVCEGDNSMRVVIEWERLSDQRQTKSVRERERLLNEGQQSTHTHTHTHTHKRNAGAFPGMPLWWLADEIAPHLPVELDFQQVCVCACLYVCSCVCVCACACACVCASARACVCGCACV